MNKDNLQEQDKSQTELEILYEDDERAFESPIEGFRKGWKDMLDGNTIPASKILDALNNEN